MAIYRTAVRHDYPLVGQPGYNIFHFRTTVDQAPQSALLQSAGDALQTFYTALAEIFPGSSTHVWEGEWSQVDGETYIPPLVGWSVDGNPGNGTTYGPAASCICITWRTAENSASGRGRTFLGPVALGISAGDGTPDSDAMAIVRAAAAGLVESFAGPEPGDEGGFGVYSRTDSVIRDLVGASVTDQFAVLRSRRD